MVLRRLPSVGSRRDRFLRRRSRHGDDSSLRWRRRSCAEQPRPCRPVRQALLPGIGARRRVGRPDERRCGRDQPVVGRGRRGRRRSGVGRSGRVGRRPARRRVSPGGHGFSDQLAVQRTDLTLTRGRRVRAARAARFGLTCRRRRAPGGVLRNIERSTRIYIHFIRPKRSQVPKKLGNITESSPFTNFDLWSRIRNRNSNMSSLLISNTLRCCPYIHRNPRGSSIRPPRGSEPKPYSPEMSLNWNR